VKAIVLLGAPGVGKGTQAHWLSTIYRWPHIATGNLLRCIQDDALRHVVSETMAQGALLSDDIMARVLMARLADVNCQHGIILDGYPRTVAQAKQLKHLNIVPIVIIDCLASEATIVQRITGRRMHIASGRTYHLTDYPPKMPDCDDITGEPLSIRQDDTASVVCQRLAQYHQTAQAVVDVLKEQAPYYAIDAHASAPKILALLLNIINQTLT
jgi:adenylate kinase